MENQNTNIAPRTPESQTPSSQVPASSQNQIPPSATDVPSLDKVESGYSGFLKKKWWVVLLIALLSVGIAVVALPYGIVIFFVAVSIMKYFYENDLFAAFAASNNFSYQKKGSLGDQPGIIFQIGRGRKFADIVSGTFQQRPLLVFVYSYTVGWGRNSHTYRRAVLSIDFNTVLPGFILRRHTKFQFLEEEGESYKAAGFSEKINLEGDFNKYFQVYIRPNTQDDVLSVLSPEVMQMLIGLDKYEVEMTRGGILYVYCHGLISKKQDLLDIYKIVETLTPKISDYANRQKQLQKTAQPTVIAPTV